MPAPKKNVAFSFMLSLVDSASRPSFKAGPTIAAGDFQHSGDGSALANLATLPAADPAASRLVKISLSAAEMNYDRVTIQCVDAAGGEWDDVIISIGTTTVTVDDLVRSTTPANSLTVEADGMAHADVKEWLGVAPLALSSQQVQAVVPITQKVDVETIKTQAVTCGAGVTVLASVGTAATSTAQTGDSFTRIGAAGAGLTDLGGMSTTMKAQVESEANDALVGQNLDHLLKTAAVAGDAVDDSIIARLASKSATPSFASFVNTTDSLEALRDRGDAAWITATGFATSVALATAQTDISAILVDTGTTLDGRIPAALVGGRMDSSVGAMAADVVTAAAIADGAIDRATFAADTGKQSIRSGTAQAGAASTITLDAGASATTDFYRHSLIYLTGATGAGQARLCTDYNGTTKVATVTPAWATNPDVTSTFAVLPGGLANAVAWGGTTIVATSIPVGTAAGALGGLFISGSNSGATTMGALNLGALTVSGTTTLAAVTATTLATSGTTTLAALTVTGATTLTGAVTATNASNNLTLGTFTVTTNAIAWNAAWDAEVQSEVQDGLNAEGYTATVSGRIDVAISTRAAAAVLGALADAAADGDPTATDTAISYLKQIINTLEGTAGIPAFPVSATPGNAVSLAEAVRQIYDEVAGLNGGAMLDAAGVRSAVGLASANLDTQLASIKTDTGTTLPGTLVTIASYIDTEVAAIKAKTDLIPASPAAVGSAMTLTSGERDSIAAAAGARQMTEGYAAAGVAPTMDQMQFMVYSALAEFAISGTTLTTKRLDGTTTAMVFTLDDSANPTSRTRSG